MDLTDLWQQHKKFILAVAGALLILLIGRGVLQAFYPVAEVRRSAATLASEIKKADDVKAATVRDVESEVEALRARYRELTQSMRFKPNELFVLPANESNPRSFFFKTVLGLQRALVDAAEKQDIRVPEALGLKDTSPTEPEEIRRTLLALNVIHEVVYQAIANGVRRVERIHIEDEQRGRARGSSFVKGLQVDFDIVGNEASLRALLRSLVDGAARGEEPFLEVGTTRLNGVKGEPGMLMLRVTFSALTIEPSEELEAQ
jgi:hypothetical protein